MEKLRRIVEDKLAPLGRQVYTIVNYDNFEVLPPASARFFAMIDHNERYTLSDTRYSTNAFFRRRLGAKFIAASLDQRFYSSFAEARAGISHDRLRSRAAESSKEGNDPIIAR